ncbi:hypothetical protein F4861DRAFT_520174 [Xylaria intraflava]|nr:hypothetical protein F4861DRAFT_520174 [Xylaria intraflava]
MDYTAAAIRFGRLARHLIPRDDDDKCHPEPDINLCEKSATSSNATPITIGVTVGVVVFGTLAVLTFLHLRRKRRDEQEWGKDQQELEDYGFTASPTSVRQPPNAYYHQQNQYEQQQQQRRQQSQQQAQQQSQHDPYKHQDTRHDAQYDAKLASQNSARTSLDDLERSLRTGQTTGAFRRQEERVPADSMPIEPSDHI